MAKKSKFQEEERAGALHDALEELSGEGELDSRGSFTLSPEEAARKLGAAQLPTPESWILVLIQAANRGGASLVEVSQSVSQTTVEIKGLEKWDWPELEPHLAQAEGASALAALAVVLRALAGATEKHDFSLTSPTGTVIRWQEGRWSRSQASSLFGRSKDKTTLAFSHLPIAGKELGMFDRASVSRKQLTALYSTMAKDALASAVPIRCDGRWLTGCAHAGDPPPGAKTRQVALVPIALSSPPPVAFPVPTGWSNLGPSDSEMGMRFRIPASAAPPRSGLMKTPALALLYVALHFVGEGKHATLTLGQARSQVCWVKDGVVIERKTLKIEGALGVLVYVNANGLPTDISGLALQKGRDRDARFGELRKALPDALRALFERDVEAVKVDSEWRPVWTYVAAGAVFAGGIFSGGLGFLFGPMMAGFVGSMGLDHKKRLQQMDGQLDIELRKLAGKVQGAL